MAQALLTGKRAFVAASGEFGIGRRLAAGLVAQGAAVNSIALVDGRRETVMQDFAQAAAESGAPDLVVISIMPAASTESRPLVEATDEQWQAGCRAIISATLHCLQAAYQCMAQHGGGAVVLLGPSFSLSGSAGLIPLSTACEAQRGMMKSAARQWGGQGFTFNWIAAEAKMLASAFDDADLPFRPERVPVALGEALDLEEIVPIIAFLGSAAGRRITGASMCLDGGEWMVP